MALVGFLLARLGLVGQGIENTLYIAAIPLASFHWAREGLEKLLEELEGEGKTVVLVGEDLASWWRRSTSDAKRAA